ncbi:hypothetical protein EUU23_08700 [Sphingorhabdus sp. IMCC26285]|uniref:Uncharacterized protein n=1 Tax=Sphingorhabdus profundilacus TaxID=2509718 RepID=A0A6I4M0N1_9SPHN|nr:hypothetical protein [Sphingorhabdus profundilacus]MVZ97784.1 hypothetical protein [Sphingorhabdus profundilacus]
MTMILAATTVVAAPQQKADAPPCPSGIILVSKSAAPERDTRMEPQLPRAHADPKGPAVLLPACKVEERKKKDFPLA